MLGILRIVALMNTHFHIHDITTVYLILLTMVSLRNQMEKLVEYALFFEWKVYILRIINVLPQPITKSAHFKSSYRSNIPVE
jgi:hypothetical protein